MRSLASIFADIIAVVGDNLWTAPGIANLTSLPRDKWAHLRASLVSCDAVNAASLAAVDDALFSLVLHEAVIGDDITAAFTHSVFGDGRRVWYDKCFNVIVFSDGRAATNMEHAWSDAGPPSVRTIARNLRLASGIQYF